MVEKNHSFIVRTFLLFIRSSKANKANKANQKPKIKNKKARHLFFFVLI